ncbi:hypothetical protein [Yinghuangia aomiensis]|uniref:hypothetical protein n=1 Tax=Yinghuangia aomiensis TaxID=676205 RepID=UPI0031E89306
MERSERPRWDGDVRAAVRVYGGWFVALVGGLLCAIGWYGVSGEKYEARQIPYLASASIPGAALIIAGAVLIAARSRASDAELRQRVAELHGLLVEVPEGGATTGGAAAPTDGTAAEDPAKPGTAAAAAGATSAVGAVGAATADGPARPATESPATEAPWLAVPDGARYHRPDCTLVVGKPTAYPVTRVEAAEQGLRPCPLCDPGDLGPAEPTPDAPDGAPSSAPKQSPRTTPKPPTDPAPTTPDEPGTSPAPGPTAHASVASGATPAAPDTPKPVRQPTNHPSGRTRMDAPRWTPEDRGALPAVPRPCLAPGRRAVHPQRTHTHAHVPQGSCRHGVAAAFAVPRSGEETLATAHDDNIRCHAVESAPPGSARESVARHIADSRRTAPRPPHAPRAVASCPFAAATPLRLRHAPRRTVSAAVPPIRSREMGDSPPASPVSVSLSPTPAP